MQYDKMWLWLLWFHLMWCGVVLFVLVPGGVWCDMVAFIAIPFDMIWSGPLWCGAVTCLIPIKYIHCNDVCCAVVWLHLLWQLLLWYDAVLIVAMMFVAIQYGVNCCSNVCCNSNWYNAVQLGLLKNKNHLFFYNIPLVWGWLYICLLIWSVIHIPISIHPGVHHVIS